MSIDKWQQVPVEYPKGEENPLIRERLDESAPRNRLFFEAFKPSSYRPSVIFSRTLIEYSPRKKTRDFSKPNTHIPTGSLPLTPVRADREPPLRVIISPRCTCSSGFLPPAALGASALLIAHYPLEHRVDGVAPCRPVMIAALGPSGYEAPSLLSSVPAVIRCFSGRCGYLKNGAIQNFYWVRRGQFFAIYPPTSEYAIFQ